MAHTLSSHEIALLVGSQAFSRGERYVRNGHVQKQTWFGSGTQLFGQVRGTRPEPYSVTVSFTVNAAGQASRATGVCTCPVKRNCKHVAALLLASRDSPADGPDGPIRERRMPAFEPGARPAAPRAPSQQGVSVVRTRARLALQFELLAPISTGWYSAGRTRPARRLGIRPMVMGSGGSWIRGGLTWDNLLYSLDSLDATHVSILTSLRALYAAGRGYRAPADNWLHLDDAGNEDLWEILDTAQGARMPLVYANPAQDPVVLSSAPATLAVDISRGEAGLALTPTVTLAGRRLDRQHLGFLGDPAHGLFAWDGPGGEAAPGGDVRLTLAQLSHPVSAQLRALAESANRLVRSNDEDAFLAQVYPFLRRQGAVTSRDGSFDLPDIPRPVLALAITHSDETAAGPRIGVRWDWRYLAPGDSPAAVSGSRRPLWPWPGDTAFRDEGREADILNALGPALARFPTIAPQHRGAPRLNASAGLAGGAMIAFLDAVPEFTRSGDVVVEVIGDAPDYRAAEQPPVISLATTDRADSRDWFDLAVTVSIDGESIPFDALFLALAADRDVMILRSGTYFSLDRPELHQLRRLIEEARALQEPGSAALGISRFQVDLWDELQALGVVAAQAAAWRETMAGLAATVSTDATALPGCPLPSGIQATLRGYQQAGYDWLSFLYDHQLGGILADDMGLGKTLQAIALIARAREQGAGRDEPGARPPFLVVAPTSVVPNWSVECARFAPGLTVATITETTRKRGTVLADVIAGANVVITSYTLFRLDFEEYNAREWAGLLLDEAQFVKNHQSRAHQCARRLSTPFKLAITGTPLENNLMEFWSLLSITAPGLFPSPSRFAEYYRKPIEKESDGDRLDQLRRRIRPFMLRRTKDEVARDLPAKQEQVLELELHPKHRKVYETHLQRERQKVLGLIGDLGANRFEIFRSLTMLRQLSLDASLYDPAYEGIPSTKLDALLELLADTVAEGHRTLIFSQFTQYLGKARDRLDAAGISYAYLDGKTRNRARVIADFKEGDASVFLISLKAGGFGLNLTEADYVILLDPWWNPATEAQAVDRVHRIGQSKNVMVYRLVSRDTIEEKVMALKAAKARLFDSVMTTGSAHGTALSAADIRELLA
ncbi:helicase [Cryobacterium sp. TMT1-2-1]|uniref:DEAD/DEAH box helicase n=1 Tax=Cryobacterium sp. TMT1-2-1 TaxID=1259232 RepID=UPI0010698BF7|nr:DEAD/DEAH box helicase [Cryobacterium sp. TMT1-2-1]TFD41985.1 helicase [Cryobacterium sp. TMT1-2-1]